MTHPSFIREQEHAAWFGRGPDRYVMRGAEVFRQPAGWFARCGKRVRGPLSSLDAAMVAAERLVTEAATMTEDAL